MLITLLTAASATLSAAPVGYSINSDSFTSEPDSLFTIDLSTGKTIANKGIVQLPPLASGRRQDVEGLAFAPDGTLYGIDDETLKLFRINPASALVDPDRDYLVTGGGLTPKDNDFGMTFTCDGSLYVSSVTKESLYRIELTGSNIATATRVGAEGGLNVKIGALAAYGNNPTLLYGLSNGELGNNAVGPPHLYSINPDTGATTDLGQLGGSFRPFAEAGLSFGDNENELWAVTDTSPNVEASQVLRINIATRTVVETHTTQETGFESLAIAPPAGCGIIDPENVATFVARKRFDDGNNITPVTFNFKCNGATVPNTSKTIIPEANGFGPYEVAFNVGNIPNGTAVDCEIEEEIPPGYTAEYECQSDGSCSTNEGAGPCVFQSVSTGQVGYCNVNNLIDPVKLTVTKEWDILDTESIIEDDAEIVLLCSNVVDGDGEFTGRRMRWVWDFEGNPASHVATFSPDFDGETQCWTKERLSTSAIETESTCSEPISVPLGDTRPECIVTNTVFYEGIPTLSPLGLALISTLMLLTGLISFRRFA